MFSSHSTLASASDSSLQQPSVPNNSPHIVAVLPSRNFSHTGDRAHIDALHPSFLALRAGRSLPVTLDDDELCTSVDGFD